MGPTSPVAPAEPASATNAHALLVLVTGSSLPPVAFTQTHEEP
jgi:hypothetical protein